MKDNSYQITELSIAEGTKIVSRYVDIEEFKILTKVQDLKIKALEDLITRNTIQLDIVQKQKMSIDRDFHRLSKANRCIKNINLVLFVALVGALPFVFY